MSRSELACRASHIPDPSSYLYQQQAGGDVRKAVASAWEHLLRVVVNLLPGSVTIMVRFLFDPAADHPQSRLSIFLLVRSHAAESADVLPVFLAGSPLTSFYGLERAECHFNVEKMGAACDVVRREVCFEPLHSSEFNSRIPPVYYAPEPFQSNGENDGLSLDRIMDSVNETVIGEICVQPTEISQERLHHTKLLARLQSVNHTWHGEDSVDPIDVSDQENAFRLKTRVDSLRLNDPLADEVFYQQKRFHEDFREPHFLFHIRVLAKTEPTARLIGSVVADSAFKEGSYQLFTSSPSDIFFHTASQAAQERRLLPFPTHGVILGQREMRFYQGLARLAHIAPVSQLLGVFRLPIASFGSPKCVRKNTDPAGASREDFIVFGYDEEF